MNMLEDPQVVRKLTSYETMVKTEWQNFAKILNKYPGIFPQKYISRPLFNNYYAQVCTRCFGYGLDSTSMVPMADNLNHSSVDITQELVNLTLHKDGHKNSEYYRVSKYLNDYSAAYKAHGYSDDEINKYDVNIKGRYNRKIFELNQESLSVENLRANLLLNKKQIWQVPCYIDSLKEDNDTSSDDESDTGKDNSGGSKADALEFFIKKEKKILKSRQNKEEETSVVDLTEIEQQLKEVLRDSNFSNDRISSILAS